MESGIVSRTTYSSMGMSGSLKGTRFPAARFQEVGGREGKGRCDMQHSICIFSQTRERERESPLIASWQRNDKIEIDENNLLLFPALRLSTQQRRKVLTSIKKRFSS